MSDSTPATEWTIPQPGPSAEHDPVSDRPGHTPDVRSNRSSYTIFIRQGPRSLEAALRFYGVHGQADRRAHEANSDVEATVAVLVWCDGAATLAFGAQAGTSLADLATSDRGFLEWVRSVVLSACSCDIGHRTALDLGSIDICVESPEPSASPRG